MTEPWFFAALVLVVLIALCTLRLLWGPTAADRVISIDTVNTLMVATLVLLGVAYRQVIFVDVAIVYAFLSFVSTLFIAKYLGGEI